MAERGAKVVVNYSRSREDIAHMICAVLEQPSMTGQLITVDAGQTL
ncbi:hypothetical protein [Paenibacillus sp. Root52]